MVKWHSVVKNPSKARLPHFFLGLFFITAFLCFSNLPLAHSAQVTLAWDPSPSTVSGYKLYYGTTSGNYPSSADAQTSTTYTLNLTAPTQYIVAKAYDGSGNESAPSNQVVAHTMTASAGAGGSISPSGTSYAAQGSSKTFTITPNTGYQVAAVTVDSRIRGSRHNLLLLQHLGSSHDFSDFRSEYNHVTPSRALPAPTAPFLPQAPSPSTRVPTRPSPSLQAPATRSPTSWWTASPWEPSPPTPSPTSRPITPSPPPLPSKPSPSRAPPAPTAPFLPRLRLRQPGCQPDLLHHPKLRLQGR